MPIPTTMSWAGVAICAPSKFTMLAAHLKRPAPIILRGRVGGCSRGAARVQVRAAVETLLADEGTMAGMGPLCHVAWAAHLPRVSEIAPLAGAARDAAVAASQTADQLMQHKREAALQFWQERKRVTAPAWEAPPGTPKPRAKSSGGARLRGGALCEIAMARAFRPGA